VASVGVAMAAIINDSPQAILKRKWMEIVRILADKITSMTELLIMFFKFDPIFTIGVLCPSINSRGARITTMNSSLSKLAKLELIQGIKPIKNPTTIFIIELEILGTNLEMKLLTVIEANIMTIMKIVFNFSTSFFLQYKFTVLDNELPKKLIWY